MNLTPSDAVYPVAKVALVMDALVAEGIPIETALRRLRLSKVDISSPATRVSLNQVIDCYCYAVEHTHNPYFAYRTGLQFHVSAYGMYGFAILSSVNYRQTMQFAIKYHQLATPLTRIAFIEDDGFGIWQLNPLPHPRIDAALAKFIVEMQFGIMVSLHRDIMGSSFCARQFQVTYPQTHGMSEYAHVFGAPVLFAQSANKLLFDASWLDHKLSLGNEITHATVVNLCDAQMENFKAGKGVAGEVRRLLMQSMLRPKRFQNVAQSLNMSVRTLRRRLQEENSSFRQLVDELRRDMAIQYLRETDLTVEEIAETLGFSDAANFRQAFRRWTNATPREFKDAPRI